MKKNIVFFLIIFFLILVVISIVYINKYKVTISFENYKIKFNNLLASDSNYQLEICEENKCIYDKEIKVIARIDNLKENSKYKLVTTVDNQTNEFVIVSNETTILLPQNSEGKKKIILNLYENDEIVKNIENEIYVVFNYQKQYLDEMSESGVQVHYRDGTKEKIESSIDLLKNLGVNYIRADFLYNSIYFEDGTQSYAAYDKWITKIKNNTNLRILATLGGYALCDNNKKFDSEIEINEYKSFPKILSNRFSNIDFFEVFNEINLEASYKKAYCTEEDMKYYKMLLESIDQKNIMISGTSTTKYLTENSISSIDFYNLLNNVGGLDQISDVAIHPYTTNNVSRVSDIISQHRKLFNNFGGFLNLNVTEYGSSLLLVSDKTQADDLVKQTIILNNNNIKLKMLYTLWTTTSDSKSYEQFGLLTNDYKPRLSYYSMKNYCQNTNGAEYIGSVPNVADGLEIHVYDKDGTPLIVCWSNDNSKTIEIPYSGFTAYDLYGNEIENTNGKLSITSSPVYLKNADRSYFYRAISNTAVSAYDEFLTNYADYLDSSDEMIAVKNKVNQMRKYAEGLTNGGEVSEAEALSKIKEHFAIGDTILKAYKDGNLSCEYVKLSSMLDQLNTTAYAFEDLVTITAKDVSNAKLTETEKIMNTFENKVSANVSVDMVYPNKIKTFAKDYYDTSSYINGLEEDNPIKNGLIISKGLHAYYLADWADSFADCYLETPEITIQYSNTELTNEDVVVTLETNVPIEMEGSNQYTFTENGSFTFKYTLYGEQKEITAVVDWIDKDAPVINGIDEREDETEQVTLTVTDANLDTVTVTKDGQDVLFNDGDVLIEKGEYEVVARDRAGNSSKRSFKIVDYIESNKTYYVSPNGNGDGSSEDASMSVKDLNKLKLYAGDKILLKSGEKYSVNIECKRKGSPDNRVVISNYGEGALPVVNGSLDLVSNLEISNLRFTNSTESCLVTNYDYCENVKIENCIFNNVADSAIYLNRQVSNFEITNCIFKNCKNAGITMKNDLQNLMVSSIKIKNNIFVNLSKSIDLASESADNTFEKVEISENYFIVQTSDEAVIKIGKIVADKFDVCVYSNLFYSFSKAYKVCEDSLKDIKDHLLCDYNTFYAYKESKYLNDITDIKTLNDEYGNEANSNVIVIDREKYDVYECLNTTLKLDDKEQILSNLTEKIDIGNRRMQIDVVGNPDKIIKNKVMGLEEMRKSDIEEVTDSSVADEVLPLAGWQKVSIAIISIIVITGLFSAGKYSKYKKDTKKQIRRK